MTQSVTLTGMSIIISKSQCLAVCALHLVLKAYVIYPLPPYYLLCYSNDYENQVFEDGHQYSSFQRC